MTNRERQIATRILGLMARDIEVRVREAVAQHVKSCPYLPDDLARTLAVQTIAGSGLLARASADDPGTLRQNVTSPGGTTAAALDVLIGRLGPLMNVATEAARDRGVELGRS